MPESEAQPLVITRLPVPTPIHRSDSKYQSEVLALDYAPRKAFDEWLALCEGIVQHGGDALFLFDEADEPFLGHQALELDAGGAITAPGSREELGTIDRVLTERVFTSNGPWINLQAGELTAVMPHLLPHRVLETSYYDRLLNELADSSGYRLHIIDNPHRWEGMADVCAIGDTLILSYAVPSHYHEFPTPQNRSTFEGVAWAADRIGIPEKQRVYVELVYPHCHGDLAHVALRPGPGASILVHFPAGLWGDGSERVASALGDTALLPLEPEDAVEHFAGNCKQVGDTVLIPEKVSFEFQVQLEKEGLECHRLELFELFGQAEGGPACLTLDLPAELQVAEDCPLRFSQQREALARHRERLPERLSLDPEFLNNL